MQEESTHNKFNGIFTTLKSDYIILKIQKYINEITH